MAPPWARLNKLAFSLQHFISARAWVCRFSALERMAGEIEGSLPGLASQIWRCISAGDGRVLNGASSALADTRATRQQNLSELRSTIEEWARSMHRLGAAERSQVTLPCAFYSLCARLSLCALFNPT